ncbi:MAG TPA: WhiB family transcriptional regulator [Acidimicrobiales bacterium]
MSLDRLFPDPVDDLLEPTPPMRVRQRMPLWEPDRAEFADVLFARPSWWDDAACAGEDTDLFFPTRGDTSALRAAKAICARCPVRERCLEDALAAPLDRCGVFGGTTSKERARIRRERTRKAA